MLTLHEVEEHLYGLMCRSYEVRRDEALHGETEATSEARKRRDEHWRALIHAYDAMAAQAKDLETALTIERTTSTNRLDLLKAKDEHIAELERERAEWASIDATPLAGRLFESETLDKALAKIIAMEDASIAHRERIAELEELLAADDLMTKLELQHTRKRITELEAVIKCACDFLDTLQKDAGVGEGTAFMLRAALEHKEA